MRKSQPTLGRRLLRACVATGAVAAVLFAAAPPAFAANVNVTIAPTTGPIVGGPAITVTGTGLATDFALASQIEVRFTTVAACPATLGATSATNIKAPTVVRVSANELTVTPPDPLGTVPATYRVCIYGASSGTPTTTSPIIGNASTASGSYRTYVAATLSPLTGPAGGGNSITLNATGLVGTGTTVGAILATAACPQTYTTSGNIVPTSTTKNSADQVTVVVPATAVAPSVYNVCLYNGTTVGTSLLIGTGGASQYSPKYPQVTLSATSGKNAGGNTITGTSTGLYATGTPSFVFSASLTCPSTYGTPDGDLVATTTTTDDVATLSVPTGVLAPNVYNLCVYDGTNVGSLLVGTSSDTYTPTVPAVSLSPDSGSTATSTTITASSTSNFLLGVTTPGATLSKTACPAKYTTTGSNFAAVSPDPVRISNTKLALTVPTTVVHDTSANTTPYNVCVYTGKTGSSTLVGTSVYRVGAVLTVSTISPASGPAQGGSEITVTGAGFTAGLTATIGGSPITNISVTDSTTFTGLTSPHAAGTSLALVVKTGAGSKTKSAAFSYTFGITVTPNTAPSNTSVTLDVLGAGFEDLAPFTSVNSNSANSHVYLVRGGSGTATAYDPTTNGGVKTNPQIQECTNVLVISNLELLCTLNLADSLTNAATPAATGTPVPEGTYTVTVVNTGAITPVAGITKSLITSGSTFTVSPY